MAIPVLTLGACGEKKNPLLVTSTAPYEAPLFPQITNEDYKPAFDKALEEARADIDRIVNNPDEPTFANTVEALAFSGERLDNVSSVFFNLNEANTNDTMQNLALEISPVLTEFSNDITLNPALFERVKAVYARRDSLALTPEQSRLLEKTYKDFARNGAALSETDKKTYRELTAKLSQLTQKFNQNTLGATNAFILHITDSAQVAELLASELDGQQRKYPRSTPSEEESMAIQRLRSTAQMKALMLGAGPMAAAAGNADDAPSDDPFVVQSRSGTDWTVLYYPSIGMADSLSTPLNRTVNIVAVDHVEDALPTLRPYAQWLQTCGVALAPDRLFDVAQRVGETGIDRICPVGEMNRAKSGWHHDGGFNLLDLVHAVDIERNTDMYCDGFDMDVE